MRSSSNCSCDSGIDFFGGHRNIAQCIGYVSFNQRDCTVSNGNVGTNSYTTEFSSGSFRQYISISAFFDATQFSFVSCGHEAICRVSSNVMIMFCRSCAYVFIIQFNVSRQCLTINGDSFVYFGIIGGMSVVAASECSFSTYSSYTIHQRNSVRSSSAFRNLCQSDVLSIIFKVRYFSRNSSSSNVCSIIFEIANFSRNSYINYFISSSQCLTINFNAFQYVDLSAFCDAIQFCNSFISKVVSGEAFAFYFANFSSNNRFNFRVISL